MCTHLQKRGAVYYFRRAIPKALQPAFDGQTQWMHSLGTKDLTEGKRLARLAGTKTDKLIDQATEAMALAPAINRPSTSGWTGYASYEEEIAHAEHQQWENDKREAEYDRRSDYRDAISGRLKLATNTLTPEEAAIQDLLSDDRLELSLARDRLAHLQQQLAIAVASKLPDGGPEMANQMQFPTVADSSKAGAMLDPTIINLWATERKVTQKGIDAHNAVAR